ncbi:MAG: hypothetical protein KA172_04955 [Paludibacter sp.]|nr:hypothetical protein [Paludibacter sp.]
MKVTIIRLPLKQLWNSEYCIFLAQLVSILQRFNIEGLHLKKSFDKILNLMPDIGKIKAQEQGNAISKQLADMNQERKVLIKGSMEQVKTFSKLSMPGAAEHVTVMNRFFDKHGRDLGESNYNSNTERIDDFMTDYDSNATVQTAANELHVVAFFNQLRTINKQFADLYLQRSDEDSSVETVDARAIRTEMDKALTEFYSAFEFCSMEYDELDYQTPANKMNDLISHYKTELKARTSRRNSGKDVHTEDPIEPKA